MFNSRVQVVQPCQTKTKVLLNRLIGVLYMEIYGIGKSLASQESHYRNGPHFSKRLHNSLILLQRNRLQY